MDWVSNLILYCNTGNTGKCPVCGSKTIEVQEHIFGTRKSLTFICKNYEASDHFDGVSTINNENV